MKKKLLVFIGIIFLLTGSLTAKEPLKDYSFIREVCHNLSPNQETLERDLGFMKRLQLNSTRIWLSQRAYESNPEEYIKARGEIRKFAYDLGLQLKEWCELY